ncbi:hypothetical protein NA57DRAFT_70220 [Rhizodiscina lignyota]|uniref:Uncharacterized protein n=1 Tax=Rhizodiscina lignyota TaxID=1504668 RepID=A0A9P4MAI2_9PEZI|nr:hypothetical protein NA57DRAFT_70220 [Rhizodiscina lignyota]
MDSLEALQGLHRDLLNLSERRLPLLERLATELQDQLEDFRTLLQRIPRNDTSRKAVQSGKIEIDNQQYELNDDFKAGTLQLADDLDLDELQAAKLFLEAQEEAHELDRPPHIVALLRFQRRRQLLVECFRLVVQESLQDEDEGETDELSSARAFFGDIVRQTLGFQDNLLDNGSKYWRKCLGDMVDIEKWLQKLADELERVSVLGIPLPQDTSELLQFQHQSLLAQHEALAGVTSNLIKGGYTSHDDLRYLLSRTKQIDKYGRILIHYAAILTTAIAYFGPADEMCSLEDAQAIHESLVSSKDADQWSHRGFHAAAVSWWLVEFSGRFNDSSVAPRSGSDAQNEDAKRHEQFMAALKDGALQFSLTISQDINRSDWYDPARAGLISFLLHEPAMPTAEFSPPSRIIRDLIEAGFQTFTEAFVTNMPNTIRDLRSEEDKARKSMRSRFQRGNADEELHLERFLVIASYAYEGDSDSAMAFWSDSESNMYGFLQWAARRQTTPRVAAFCELIRALSDDEACADAVHQFLLDEGQPVGGRIRRTGSLSWSQILSELHFYAKDIRERPSSAQSNITGAPQIVMEEYVEPESSMMLECYLRLVAHLCLKSAKAREYASMTPQLPLYELLFELCSSSWESRLRACAFTALNALCTEKTPETSTKFWHALDQWMYGIAYTPSKQSVTLVRQEQPSRHEERALNDIATGFEEPNAFTGFVQSLIAPLDTDTGLNDRLPFPEGLGSAYRMPGIELYVDFILGRVFAERTNQLDEVLQTWILRLTCLNFAALCLSTFNEDLVAIANRASISVDSVIQTSSLSTYARLHPFSRTMEWMFNDKVTQALFATAHQPIEKVDNAPSESPLILSMVASIRVMILVMKMQSTYLDIVRPLIKTQSSTWRSTVANSAIASFEDAVLNNLQLIVDLGLYCGTGHQDLTIASLELLQLLSSSRKLVASSTTGFGYGAGKSKVITVLEHDHEAERVARVLLPEIQVDMRQLESGPDSPGYIIKRRILEFLQSCLSTLQDRPTIAHALLGFTCKPKGLTVDDAGLFGQGESLFHAILKLSLDWPDNDGGAFVYWLSAIKGLCTEILQTLWTSPLSASLVLTELQNTDYIFVQAIAQSVITPDTLWDGRSLSSPEFVLTDSAQAYCNFLRQRSAHYELVAKALRSVAHSSMQTHRARIESMLLGATNFPGMDSIPNANIFDLFDFMEMDFGYGLAPPELPLIGTLDFGICRKDPEDPSSPIELRAAEELLLLRTTELKNSGRLATPETEQQATQEAQKLMLYIHGMNQYHELVQAQRETLKRWVQLLSISLKCCKFDQKAKTSFVLQALQAILPKLERSLAEDSFTALELATLGLTLLGHMDFSSQSEQQNRVSDFTKDRLYQLFRVSLSSVTSFEATPELRNVNYQTCYRYLQGITSRSGAKSPMTKNAMNTIKHHGERLMDVVCDDAVAGHGACRVSALLVLEAFVALANKDGSKYMLDSFNRVNFIGVLVDSYKNIPTDLPNAPAADIPVLLAYYNTTFALLLRIASARGGAGAIFNAGLFNSARDSLLFSIDPDIGLEFESPEALKRFFDLMLGLLRVINAVVLSKGPQSEQTMRQARDFLRDIRPSVVGVFKRNAKIGTGKVDAGEDLTDLVDNFTVLISAVGFLEFEDKTSLAHSAPGIFS